MPINFDVPPLAVFFCVVSLISTLENSAAHPQMLYAILIVLIIVVLLDSGKFLHLMLFLAFLLALVAFPPANQFGAAIIEHRWGIYFETMDYLRIIVYGGMLLAAINNNNNRNSSTNGKPAPKTPWWLKWTFLGISAVAIKFNFFPVLNYIIDFVGCHGAKPFFFKPFDYVEQERMRSFQTEYFNYHKTYPSAERTRLSNFYMDPMRFDAEARLKYIQRSDKHFQIESYEELRTKAFEVNEKAGLFSDKYKKPEFTLAYRRMVQVRCDVHLRHHWNNRSWTQLLDDARRNDRSWWQK